MGAKAATFSEKVLTVFSSDSLTEKENTEISSEKTEKTENTNNTTSGKSQDVMNRISGKDSNSYSDLTKTPDDIAALMKQAKKTIKNEKEKGKTSEEDYQGGGTIVSFGPLAIQSKIPNSFYTLNIEELLKQKAELSIKDASKPTVLVFHSHTTEGYTLLDVGYYTKSTDLRSDDSGKNLSLIHI